METRPPRAATTNDSDKFIVRLPDGMRDRIAEEARKNGRTMNAEVVARLEQSFGHSDHMQQELQRLSARIDELRFMYDKMDGLANEALKQAAEASHRAVVAERKAAGKAK